MLFLPYRVIISRIINALIILIWIERDRLKGVFSIGIDDLINLCVRECQLQE